MDNQPNSNPDLDLFLGTLAKGLSRVSQERRDQELNEIRAHIDELSIVYQSSGDGPDPAYRQAISQMGDPVKLGEKLTQEWEQKVAVRQRTLLRAIFLSGLIGGSLQAFLYLIQVVATQLAYRSFHLDTVPSDIVRRIVEMIADVSSLCIYIYMGIYLSKLLPRELTRISLLPAVVYAGALQCLIYGVLQIVIDNFNHILNWAYLQSQNLGFTLFLMTLDAPYAICIIGVSCYGAYEFTRLKLRMPSRASWKLRVG